MLILCDRGDEGYETFSIPDIDLILLDLKLDDMDGLDVARMIRSVSTKVPIIAQIPCTISTDVLSDEVLKSIDAGCNDYISKPVEKNQLLGKINKFI